MTSPTANKTIHRSVGFTKIHLLPNGAYPVIKERTDGISERDRGKFPFPPPVPWWSTVFFKSPVLL